MEVGEPNGQRPGGVPAASPATDGWVVGVWSGGSSTSASSEPDPPADGPPADDTATDDTGLISLAESVPIADGDEVAPDGSDAGGVDADAVLRVDRGLPADRRPAGEPGGGALGPAAEAGGTGTAGREGQAVVAPPPRPQPRPGAASAAELTEDAIVRFRGDRPQHGWRGALYRATRGMVNPGVGPVERARQEQLRRVRRPLAGSYQIAVSSIKGGVGKTTVAACLGLVLAQRRGDRVIALDANPDAGTLADRLTAETSLTVRNLLDNIGAACSLTDVARYTSLAGRLQVLASEQDPAMSEAFTRDEYERVCAVLTRFYNIIITDSGTGLVHSAMEGTLAMADSLVVVGAPTVDGASRASKTLDWLLAHGHAARVADAVVVLSCDRTSKEVDGARVRSHFEARCRAVVEVPHDPHLATGGRIELPRLKPATYDAFLALAAHLADGFPAGAQPVARPGPVPSLT